MSSHEVILDEDAPRDNERSGTFNQRYSDPEMTQEQARKLIESGYKVLPPQLHHLTQTPQWRANYDRKRLVQNAFLLGYGEDLLSELLAIKKG